MSALPISFPPEAIAALCERNHITRLALFGSVLRDDFRPDSDIDVLVEFEPGHVPGLRFFDMQDELSAMAGQRVDLNTPGFLGARFRDAVVAGSATVYAAL